MVSNYETLYDYNDLKFSENILTFPKWYIHGKFLESLSENSLFTLYQTDSHEENEVGKIDNTLCQCNFQGSMFLKDRGDIFSHGKLEVALVTL